jgi:hypothetical protein
MQRLCFCEGENSTAAVQREKKRQFIAEQAQGKALACPA